MNIKPIHSEDDYVESLARIDALMDAKPGTPQGDELDILATLVEAYEESRYPVEAPDPVEFIKNVMEFLGLDQAELGRLLQSRPRASEILNRRRQLTLNQIRQITTAWKVPADPLIREYELTSHG
ncbi:MAG: transcriptional regulator [Lysobacterales bacterium]